MIRKITPDGLASTLAGSPGLAGSTDGTGADARFNNPNDVVVDAAGNLYIADSGNAAIRKITPAGVTTTLAGSTATPITALGTAPSFARPQNLAIIGDSLAITDANAVLLFRHVVH